MSHFELSSFCFLLPHTQDFEDWQRRVLGGVALFVDALPNVKVTSIEQDGKYILVEDLVKSIKKISKTKWRGFVISNRLVEGGGVISMGDDRYVDISGLSQDTFDKYKNKFLGVPGVSSLTFSFYEKRSSNVEKLFFELGNVVDALSGYYLPHEFHRILLAADKSLNSSIPAPHRSREIEIARDFLSASSESFKFARQRSTGGYHEAHDQIVDLGWLNYWGPESCKRLGFPDTRFDEELLQRAFLNERSAWCVKLTEAPLSPSRREHIEAYVHWYCRFQEIGLRRPERPLSM